MEWVSQVVDLPRDENQKQQQHEEHANVPITGSLFSLAAGALLPTSWVSGLTNMAFKYAFQQLVNQVKTPTTQEIILKNILSIPSSAFLPVFFGRGQAGGSIQTDPTTGGQERSINNTGKLDQAIDTYEKRGDLISKEGRITQDIKVSNRFIMIMFVSVLSFFFQYMGMNIMKKTISQNKGLTDLIEDEDDNRWANPNAWYKKKIASIYKQHSYYSTNRNPIEEANTTWEIKDFNSIRILYNTLVGMNYSLFRCMGGESDDPSHEIIHWTKILLYWEILVRLVKLHGLGPVRIATQLVLHTLMDKGREGLSKQRVQV